VADWSLAVDDVLCTMASSTERCGLESRITGRAKPPTNVELYCKLFGVAPVGVRLHDAADDVQVTAASYVAGLREGWW